MDFDTCSELLQQTSKPRLSNKFVTYFVQKQLQNGASTSLISVCMGGFSFITPQIIDMHFDTCNG